MKKSTLIMILSLIMAVAVGMGSTVAYLQDTDEDVNVMTLGNVKIEQIEKERIEQSDDNVNPDNIQDFTQGKPLYPVVGTNDWAENNQQWPTGGSSQMHNDELKNVVDKFVFVENTGKSDAYVRTIFAFEAGELTFAEWDKMMHWNINGVHWDWNGFEAEEATLVTIDGNKYFLVEALYLGNAGTNQDVHKDGILAPGETTRPSLLQFWMDWDATNETMEAIDGNGNGTYDILVVSQAVQTMGFADAQTALDTAFGDVTAKNNPWKENDEDIDGTPAFPIVVNNAEELQNILSENTDAKSGDVVVNIINDIDASDIDWEPISVDGYRGAGIITVKGNGNTISNLSAPLFAGGFAGKSGIVIEDLTIADSEMTAPTDQGSGAFICCADSMTEITLDNCHAKNVKLSGASRTGGLIGWTSGYSRQDDGPVKTYVTIDGCTVKNCTINAETESAGGFIGHSGASDWTYTTVTNSAVIDTVINGGSDRTGIYLGTSNVGETTFTNCTYENVTGTLNEAHELYGRTAHGTTGKLTIDGVAIN